MDSAGAIFGYSLVATLVGAPWLRVALAKGDVETARRTREAGFAMVAVVFLLWVAKVTNLDGRGGDTVVEASDS